MRLTERERRMEAGELGEPVRRALAQQVAVGEFFGAERMVAVRNVQGLVLAKIPVMHRLQPDPFGVLRTGDRVRLSPARGVVESLEKVDSLDKEVRR